MKCIALSVRKYLAVFFVVLGAGLLFSACDSSDPIDGGVEVTVMTRNLYLGGDLFTVVGATSPTQVPLLVGQLWQAIEASNFAERAEALADEIVENQPHLVGLQEVSLYRTQTPSDYLTGNVEVNASTVAIDFLQLLMDALEERGADYRVVATSNNADVEMPAVFSLTQTMDIRLSDRDVILARGDVEVSGPVTRNFSLNLSIPIGGEGGPTVSFTRGYGLVMAVVDGVQFTFANAHLEVGGEAAFFQEAQARELVNNLQSLPDPVILVGDFNSPADGSDTDSYGVLTERYTDAWAELQSANGFTCCQAADLRNTTSQLDNRIDLILYRGNVEAQEIDLVGENPADRTPSGLWPSDHAGVVATLVITQ